MYKDQAKPDNGRATVAFFDWAFEKGAKTAADLDYVPLPDVLTQVIAEKVWSQIKH